MIAIVFDTLSGNRHRYCRRNYETAQDCRRDDDAERLRNADDCNVEQHHKRVGAEYSAQRYTREFESVVGNV